MSKTLVNSDSHNLSLQALESLYADRRIPAEKKPFLISLRDSSGPLMVVDQGGAILDVASQIATLATGFNPGAAFGAAQFIESWTGRTDTKTCRIVRAAFTNLLNRQLTGDDFHVHLCHSGAEAIETALGMCYQQRVRPSAHRVLAFCNSFHGRMMVALASTWSPAKREPFAWPQCQSGFVDYPEIQNGDDVRRIGPPDGWNRMWSCAPRIDFANESGLQAGTDPLLQLEIESLMQVREQLGTGEYFAVIIEPMQCEGGDRYSSARFHNGLINLCRAFGVPLVYDEIQTGFGLGGDFFWHRKFDLCDSRGQPTGPDFVVIAKKAQVGAVLSRQPCPFPEEFNAASLIRGFVQASVIEQFRPEIDAIEQRARHELKELIQQFAPAIFRPRVSGLSFAFDFQEPDVLKRFVGRRFHNGLLFYPAGDRAARFRFNLAFREPWQEIAWRQIKCALKESIHEHENGQRVELNPATADLTRQYYSFHQAFLTRKLARIGVLKNEPPDTDVREEIKNLLTRAGWGHLEFDELDAQSWPDVREQVARLQQEVYEPLRQTPVEKFDSLIQAENGIALIVREAKKIVAMAFAAPPANFSSERGLRSDERFDDPKTIYMLDLTVLPDWRGGLGRIMKQAVCLLAQQRGIKSVIGRNRDQLARGMWAINLSLGSYCTRVIRDDYQDEYDHRDCLMYRCDLQWDVPPVNLSRGVACPMTHLDLSAKFCHDNLPTLVNKLTLSNFVTPDFLENLEFVFSLLPRELQHCYTASGISECVDKLVKAIWLSRKPRNRLVTIGGSYFGNGSFLSRTLSGTGDSWFDVARIPWNENGGPANQLAKSLVDDGVLAVFVEPLGWKNGRRIPLDELIRFQGICADHNVPLVSHDSGGLFYRYSSSAFGPVGGGFLPDAGMMSLGGQMALVYMNESLFDDTPLRFISTWDGDAFSLAQFAEMARRVGNNRSAHELLVERFQSLLETKLAACGIADYDLQRGCGWFEGSVDARLDQCFEKSRDLRRVCLPGPGSMQQFVDLYGV